MACARLHAALMARAPPPAPSLGNRARTWSIRPPSRRRFASSDAAAADADADDAAAADARTIVPEADAPRSSPEASAPRGAVVWFRQDLRVDDNQAFRAAVRAANRRGGEVLCLFVWSPDEEGDDEGASWAPGEASRVWLHHSLASLDRDMRRRYGGGGVRFARGPHAESVAAAAQTVNATTVFASTRYEPAHVEGDERTRRALAERGIELITLPGHLLFDREKIRVDMERERYFFGTLMPFVHAAEKFGGKPGTPSPAPPTAPIARGSGGAGESTLASLGLIPPSDARVDWSAGLRAEWDMSESGATEAWAQFKRMGLAGYEDGHGRCDLTAKSSTSVLSPYLRFGQLSPRRVYAELRDVRFGGTDFGGVEGRRLSRTFWHRLYRREFAYWQLGVFPRLAVESWRSHYEQRGDWRWPERDPAAAEDLRRWQKGQTGFPVVDAGMRRLVRTGWMHQTERMLAATFLVDYLNVHWSHGARWFHDYLVDADLAINSMMWQNAGKSGLDQWDVFAGGLAPDGSSRTHDPTGETIARYVPELAGLPPGHLRHRPWEASAKTLRAAGVTIGHTYPARIVADVDAARARMSAGVLEVRAREVAKAAAAAAEEAGPPSEDGDDERGGRTDALEKGGRTDVLVDVFTGADYVVAPPGSTVAADGRLLPLSTRKEFKRALAQAESGGGVRSAMGAARDWALARLDVAATGAGSSGRGCEPSADETGSARAADIGRKRAARAAAAGHSHSHSHSHGGHSHSHSHGGHSHAPGEAIGRAHVGHTHGGGGRRSGSRSTSRGVEHRSSSWAKGGGSGRKAAKGVTAKEAERKKVKAGRREARELGRAWSSGLRVGDVGGSGDESSAWE